MEQHPPGRIDSEALEELGMAQRKLDHLTQGVDRAAHAAEIVISDVGPALAVDRLVLGKKLDGGLGVDVDDALGHGGDDDQPHLLQREGRSVEHLADGLGHVGVHPLVAGGRHRVALGQRTAGERALQRIGRALQADVRLGRGEDDPRGGLGLRLAHLDEIGRADPGIGALQPVQPDDVDALVLAVGADRDRRGRALAHDLDDVAVANAELFHQRFGEAREAASAVAGRQARDLHLARLHAGHRVRLSHSCSFPARSSRIGNGGMPRGFISLLNI